jgi:hypothetical protein
VKKEECLSSQKKEIKYIDCCLVRKPQMVRQADITGCRMNEATAFTKLFTSDKNPELRNVTGISRRIKCKLKIKCGKDIQIPVRNITIKNTEYYSK